MNINNAFPSKWLRSGDLADRHHEVMIREFQIEDVSKTERKPVIYFEGKQKGLVLNRTNSDTITQAFGPETDNWLGKVLVIYSAQTTYMGKTTDGVRVRIPEPQGGHTQAQTQEPPPQDDNGGDFGGAPNINDPIPF